MSKSIYALALCTLVFSASCMCGKQPPATPTLKDEREACETDEECKTGLCEAVPGFQTVCTRKCTDGCHADEVCEQLTPGRFACTADRGGLCRECMLDTDCPYPSDKCIRVDNKGICGRDCAFDQNCPTSYRCLNGVGVDGKPKPQQCTPTSGSCSCTAASAGQTISCMSTNSVGTCNGVQTCDGVMGYDACNARTPSAEICNGIDDNCNNLTDEGLPEVNCGIGACKRVTPLCGSDGGVITCTPGLPTTEICNNIDDDCDGFTDNGFNVQSDVNNCGMCNNRCMLPNSTPRCASGSCEVLSCNAGFANCNGVFSDGCEVNTGTNVNHCGACNHQCMAAGADSSCVSGMCQFACRPNFYDLDGDPANGCEYACTATSTIDEPDPQFLDANCDGMDGELNNGIYVSPLGNDGNPGTRQQPKLTILVAAQAAIAGGKRDVYVSGGTYNGPIDLTGIQGINIAGGYAPSATRPWTRSPVNTTTMQGGSPALLLSGSNNLRVQFFAVRGDAVNGVDSNGNGASAYGGKVLSSTGVKLELMTFAAGAGASGADGTNGSTGSIGGNGGIGQRGCVNDGAIQCSECTQPAVGTSGASSCGRPGGAGGVPGRKRDNSPESHGFAGSIGQLTTSPGQGTSCNTSDSDPYTTVQAIQYGANGTPGTAVTNAMQCSALGTLTAAGYLAPVCLAGSSGNPGNGGGGGGGGGGGCEPRFFLGAEICDCYSFGSSGGGGGGGGCGGNGGGPGKSGGASIALLLFNSTVLTQNITVLPGRGGNGGKGGNGGSGGSGGIGASSQHDHGAQGYSQIGGKGGNGGAGSAGGHGAGGAGGASIGLLRNAASTNITGLTYTPGTGGTGGTSLGNAGPAGVTVQAQAL